MLLKWRKNYQVHSSCLHNSICRFEIYLMPIRKKKKKKKKKKTNQAKKKQTTLHIPFWASVAFSRIQSKTLLTNYIENFTTINGKFSDRKFRYFSYFCSIHRFYGFFFQQKKKNVKII